MSNLKNPMNGGVIYGGTDLKNATIGYLYYDTSDNKYKYLTGNGEWVTIDDYCDVSNNSYSYNYSNITTSTYNYKSDREYIKEYLNNDKELLNELLLELRKEKINKLKDNI